MDVDDKIVALLRKQGLTVNEITNKLNVSRAYVYQRLSSQRLKSDTIKVNNKYFLLQRDSKLEQLRGLTKLLSVSTDKFYPGFPPVDTMKHIIAVAETLIQTLRLEIRRVEELEQPKQVVELIPFVQKEEKTEEEDDTLWEEWEELDDSE